MGIALGDTIKGEEIALDRLTDKIVAVDAMNMLYQFASTIRQPDGTPLKDANGNITSHLTGLFARCSRLLQKRVKMVFVFDGQMPDLKRKERERREKLKAQAMASLSKAEDEQDIESMKKYASRTTRISKDMIDESICLLHALGIPTILAPSEGEAQAAFMVSRGDCNFVASQDYDCLIYGAPKIVRNVSISQRRKKINALTYKIIMPEIVTLSGVLNHLGISLNQLRALSMLVGTDFNVGGVKGLGPKKALQAVKKHGEDFEALFRDTNFDEECGVSWKDVYDTIANIPTTEDYELKWNSVNEQEVVKILVTTHGFSEERVRSTLENIEKSKKESRQKDLSSFFQ